MNDQITANGYNRLPSGEPCNSEDWNAGYAAGLADGKAALGQTYDEMDRQLEEAQSENEALKEQLAAFQLATGCDDAEDVQPRPSGRQHAYGHCTITGPAEDVAFIFKHLPDAADA